MGTALLLAGAIASAPRQEVLFARSYGGPGLDVGNAVAPLPDGGYAVIGYTGAPGGRDAWLLRLDAHGDTLWTRRFGGPLDDHGWDLSPTEDGGFLVVGFRATERGDDDVWIARTDSLGALLWERVLGGPADDDAWAVLGLGDGGALVLAQTASFGAGAEDVWLIRMDAAGDTLWTRTAGTPGPERAFAIARSEGGAVFTGLAGSADGRRDVLVGRVTSAGAVSWATHSVDDGDAIGHGIVALPDGGALVTGYVSRPTDPADVLFLRLDADGHEVARRVVPAAGDQRAMMSALSADGGLATVGYARDGADWDLSVALGTVDAPAERPWVLARPGDARGVQVAPVPGGGWIVTGTASERDDPGQLVVVRIPRWDG